MRLVDSDALMACVTELYEYDLCHADTDDYTEGRASAEHYIIEKIREMPAIDAIPIPWLKALMTDGDPEDSKAAWRVLKAWKEER